MTIAIIAARGGSKRLPRKNIKLFCGIPLLAWSIIQAKSSKYIDEVYVTTDDNEIADVAVEYGAKVIMRPDWVDADFAAANRPFIHAMKMLKAIHGDIFNEVLTILPTTPLNKPGDFDIGIEEYRKLGCDTMGPLRPIRETVVLEKTHPRRCRMALFDKGYKYLGEASGWVVTNPNWYIAFNSEISDLDSVLNEKENWPALERYFFPVEYWQYADVDTLEEFEFAEVVMEHFILKGRKYNEVYKYIENNILPFGGD